MKLLRQAAALLTDFRRGQVGPIGLHMARDAVHLVQLEIHAARVAGLRAWASIPMAADQGDVMQSPKRFGMLLRKALVSGGFKGRTVVSAMPSAKVKIHSVTYRPTRERTDGQEIMALMEERLEGPVADHILDFLPVRDRSVEGERLALVTVSRRADVLAHLDLLGRAGLEVAALEIGPAAIRRLVSAMTPAGDPENVLVINAGDRSSFLTMVSGRRLLFDQEIDFGEHKLIRLVASSLDMPESMVRELVINGGLASAGGATLSDVDISGAIVEIMRPELKRLAAEIERAFMYAASETRGIGARRVFLVGSIARWPGADRILGALARLPVTNVPDPLAALLERDAGIVPERSIPDIAIATGLALRDFAATPDMRVATPVATL